MKYKTTRKEAENNYKVLSVGYCAMHHLLKYEIEEAYNSGVYGWNFDLYNVNGVYIATGYRNLPYCQNMQKDYEIIKEYEEKARNINDNIRCYEERKDRTKKILNELLEKLEIKNY